MNERLYSFLAQPSIPPKGKQRQIILEIMANSKEPLSLGQIASLANEKRLMAVGGVDLSCRYHLNHLSKIGCVEIVNPTPKMEIEKLTEMSPQIAEMARDCYGYGRWDAPYWFIGIGEGMGKNDSLEKRSAVWSRLKKDGLMDCRDFHLSIGEMAWHCDKPRAKIQRTWGSLMLLLMTFLEKNSDDESRRDYQRKHWGAANGETCVIELFGLPAPTFKKYQELALTLFTQERLNEILKRRIEFIIGKIQAHKPKFVVMYGREAREQWNEIAGISLLDDEVYVMGPTMMVSATHPNDRHIKERNKYWIGLGEALRCKAKHSSRGTLLH